MQVQIGIFSAMLLGQRLPVPTGGVVHRHIMPDDRCKKINKSNNSEALVAAALLRRDGVGISTIHRSVTDGCCQRTVQNIVNRFVTLEYVRYSDPKHNPAGRGRLEKKVVVVDWDAIESLAEKVSM